jgi:hypothetical protein
MAGCQDDALDGGMIIETIEEQPKADTAKAPGVSANVYERMCLALYSYRSEPGLRENWEGDKKLHYPYKERK